MFDSPDSKQNSVRAKELLGKLMLVYPLGYVPTDARPAQGIQGTYGFRTTNPHTKQKELKDAAIAQVHVLNEEDPSVVEVYDRVPFLQGRLIGKVKRQLRKWARADVDRRFPILARLQMDGNAYEFAPATEDDAAIARAYLEANPVDVSELDVDFEERHGNSTQSTQNESTSSNEAPF